MLFNLPNPFGGTGWGERQNTRSASPRLAVWSGSPPDHLVLSVLSERAGWWNPSLTRRVYDTRMLRDVTTSCVQSADKHSEESTSTTRPVAALCGAAEKGRPSHQELATILDVMLDWMVLGWAPLPSVCASSRQCEWAASDLFVGSASEQQKTHSRFAKNVSPVRRSRPVPGVCSRPRAGNPAPERRGSAEQAQPAWPRVGRDGLSRAAGCHAPAPGRHTWTQVQRAQAKQDGGGAQHWAGGSWAWRSWASGPGPPGAPSKKPKHGWLLEFGAAQRKRRPRLIDSSLTYNSGKNCGGKAHPTAAVSEQLPEQNTCGRSRVNI